MLNEVLWEFDDLGEKRCQKKVSGHVSCEDYMGADYIAPNDCSYDLAKDAENNRFVLTDTIRGDVYIFYDFSGSHAGLLRERTTRAWQNTGRDGNVTTYDGSDQKA